MRARMSGWGWILILLVLVGCETNISSTTSPPPADPTGPATVVAAPIELHPIDVPRLDQIVAENQGKVILVDFWATWCKPCKQAFPHTVALARKYGDQPFKAMTVSLDEPDYKEDAIAFLEANEAHFDHFLSSYPGDTGFEKFDIEGIPHLRLYDKHGNLVGRWNGFSEDEVEQKIQELLAQP